MKELVALPARTPKQMLRRLYQHFTGNVIPAGQPLAAVANRLSAMTAETEILLLSERGSIWIQHVVLAENDEILVDHNTFINAKFDGTTYRALRLGGTVIEYTIRKRVTKQEFMDETGLRLEPPKPIRESEDEQ